MKKEYLLYKLYDHSSKRIKIDSELFQKYNVKKGLRNEDGTGVLVGLTNVGDVVGYEKDENGNVYPIDGKLYYRGYSINDIAEDILKNNVLITIAKKYHASPAQIALAFISTFENRIPIPKSSNKKHTLENIESQNILLSNEDIDILNKEFGEKIISLI